MTVRRHLALPRLWLFTDERGGDPLSLARGLSRGSGIVFRHHATPPRDRRAVFESVRRIARARRLVLLLAAPPAVARAWGADGAHHRSMLRSRGLRSVAVHNPRELVLAERARADLVFVSPVFATRSHPGVDPLRPARLGLLIGRSSPAVVALGGVDHEKFKRLRGLPVHGWAGIDAFTGA